MFNEKVPPLWGIFFNYAQNLEMRMRIIAPSPLSTMMFSLGMRLMAREIFHLDPAAG